MRTNLLILSSLPFVPLFLPPLSNNSHDLTFNLSPTSHAPISYSKVSDVFDIDGLTGKDKAIIRKYQDRFTIRVPGRLFNERINARQST